MWSWRRVSPRAAGGFVLLAGACVTGVAAAPRSFDFEDPLGRNSIALTMESRYQPIRGLCEATRGQLAFDPDTGRCSGTFQILTDSIRFSGDELTQDLLGPEWFGSERYPTWEITIKGVAHAQQLDEETWQIAALGAMVLRGRAGAVNFPATITYLPGGMAERTDGLVPGDLMVLRGRLSFLREDFGVHPNPDVHDVWGDEVDLEFSLVGWSNGADANH